jgi:hypothetical protein
MEKVVRIFHSFAEADAADVRERAEMSPEQRVEIFLELRNRMESDAPEPPVDKARLARVCRVLDLERS